MVVDSNVDLFLASISYDGIGTYDARRDFDPATGRAAADSDPRGVDTERNRVLEEPAQRGVTVVDLGRIRMLRR